MLVWFSHAYTLVGISWQEPLLIATKGRFGIGTIALDCFMLLSGFLLMEAYSKSPRFINFWKRRFIRIYPPYLLSIFLIAIAGIFLSELTFSQYLTSHDFFQFAENLSFFHQHFLLPAVFQNQLHKFYSVDGSIWSLPYETLLYAFIPIVFLITDKRISNVFLVLVIILLITLNNRTLILLPIFDLNVLVHLSIPFLMGVFLSNSFNKYHLILVFVFCNFLYILNHKYIESIMVFGVEAIFMYTLLLLFKRSKILYHWDFPDLSYGIFLYGFFIQQAIIELLPYAELKFSAYLILSLIVTLFIALFSWYCVEKPILKIKQKIA